MIHGLRFYRASVKIERGVGAPIFIHGRLDEDRSDFDFIFSCLYDELRDYVFVENTGEPFASHGEKYWAHALETLPGKRSYQYEIGVMPTHVLKEFGRYVSDDWNEAILFGAGLMKLEQMAAVADSLDGKAFAECEAAQVILHNWDGVYWEIFCKDSRLIEPLLQTHRDDERLTIYKVDFDLDYPDPRNVPLERA